MKDAYKYADGRRLKDQRVYIDVERGRAVKNWKPRKFSSLQEARDKRRRQ